jgi:GntR family transcriptional regulator / MocR family aminotransferase
MRKKIEPLIGLRIDIPARDSRRRLRELHGQLRAAILDARLTPGLLLPPTRSLAATLGVGRNTVVAAYDLLVSEGYAVTRPGGGTYVAKGLPRARRGDAAVAGKSPDPRLNAFWRTVSQSTQSPAQSAYRFDFRPGLPEKALFPFAIWRRLSARALRRLSKAPATYAHPQGQRALLDAIAQHVSFARAVACRAEDVVVTAGAQQAFDLLARILVTPLRTLVALEEPGYPPLRAAFAAAGARLAAVPVDRDGLVVDRLPAQARVVCVTPSHQFPLGCAMALQRRAALLEFAGRRNAVVVEDDYDGEFRFCGRPLDALQSLDRSDCVFYVGTFSKSLFPALRLGYVVASPWARNALITARKLCDWHGAQLAQDTLADFISEGHLARHVRKMRKVYAERREVLLNGLRGDLGQWLGPIDAEAGLHLTALARRPKKIDAMVELARQHGIGVYSLGAFYAGRPVKSGLVFGYGGLSVSEIEEAIAALRKIWEKADKRGRDA